MAAATAPRNTEFAGLIPARSTVGMATAEIAFKGTIATINAGGYAVEGAAADGFNAIGKFSATFDNRATAPEGGANAAIDAEIEHGVFGWAYNGTAPKSGQVVYVYDNQTVSIDSDSGTRGIAGYCSETRNSKCYTLMGPTVVAQIVIAAAEAADLDTAQTDIDALQVDAATTNALIRVPLTSLTKSDATPIGKFADGADTTFGLNIADSEALCVRWNNHATPGTALCQVELPYDLDDAGPINLEFVASKSGATLGDATTLTIAAYIITVGDLHDADTNCGGVTNALVGDATAKTTALLSRTIAAGDVPVGARSLTMSITPTAGKLGTDDLLIHSIGVRYTKKIMTA